MAKIMYWPFKNTITMICDALQNRFDFIIALEGNRGLGKSTLAYKLAMGVKREMKRREVEGYNFRPHYDLLYKRQEVIDFFNKWNGIGVADEMINVTFNRDFYKEDQKDLIKMMNMNRDHCNFFLACVPQFQTLDSQIKNLCKMRITIIRRGLAVIQTPNRTIYSRDKWDQVVNERTERTWLMKNVRKPRYSRLSTFRGMMKFSPLAKGIEDKYIKIKDMKRHEIVKEKEEEANKVIKKDDPFENIYNRFIKGEFKNHHVINGIALAQGVTPESFKVKLRKRLAEEGKNSSIPDYYKDNMGKNKDRFMETIEILNRNID